MSFSEAWHLICELEGGRVDDPRDRGGATNCGLTQHTWELLGYKQPASVMDASCGQLAAAYRSLWDSLKLYNLQARPPSAVLFSNTPEPADSVGMQFFINTPFTVFIRSFQGAVGAQMDGVLGKETWAKLQEWNGRGEALSDKLLAVQHWYYQGLPDGPFKQGWLDRVERVKQWLTARNQ